MERVVKICDVIGEEGNCRSITISVQQRKTKMDAAGDTEEWFEIEDKVYDLSFDGAMSVLHGLKCMDSVKPLLVKYLETAREHTRKKLNL